MILAVVLFVTFALLTAAGTFLVVDRFRSRRLAVVLTVGVLICFVALAALLAAMFRAAGV
jgi:drug/metabolite transporter superfamily protein YnfA